MYKIKKKKSQNTCLVKMSLERKKNVDKHQTLISNWLKTLFICDVQYFLLKQMLINTFISHLKPKYHNSAH